MVIIKMIRLTRLMMMTIPMTNPMPKHMTIQKTEKTHHAQTKTSHKTHNISMIHNK